MGIRLHKYIFNWLACEWPSTIYKFIFYLASVKFYINFTFKRLRAAIVAIGFALVRILTKFLLKIIILYRFCSFIYRLYSIP